MQELLINLLAEPRTNYHYLLHKTLVTVQGNQKGLFVNGNKVSDVFFNGIQLRLYVLGDCDVKKESNLDKNFYMIFSDNSNDLKLSFDELNEKVTEIFILAS